MSRTDAHTGRRYHGMTADERAAKRRTAILDAALELFGTSGYAANSVKQICRNAQLTERYFYESFADREDCLAVLYEQVAAESRVATVRAMGAGQGGVAPDSTAADPADAAATAGFEAFVRYLTSDERRARVLLVEVVGVSEGMERRRHRVLRDFADLTARVMSGSAEPPRRTGLLAVALAGGLNHLLVDWLLAEQRATPAELVAAAADLFAGARLRLAERG